MEDNKEIIHEFLIESYENLGRLDREFVSLEKAPRDEALLSSIFRTIHTIKGACGFLNFTKLGSLAHLAENLLSQLRQGEKELNAEIVSALLETVDAVKQILGRIEVIGEEGEEPFEELKGRLQRLAEPGVPQRDLGREGAAAGAGAGVERPPAASRAEVAGASGAGWEKEGPPQAASDGTPASNGAAPVAPSAEARPAARAARRETAGAGDAGRATAADSTIRVDVGLLDKLMNLVGELVLARNQLVQFTGLREDATFAAAAQRLNLITTELQAAVMKTRMQPIGNVWNKLPRVVRDLAASCGKQVVMEMEGAETELDKTIIEAIRDPLTHIVRNSVDHGIETPLVRAAKGKPAAGRLFLRAFHEGGQVNIEISDDGAGISVEKVRRKAVQNGRITAEQAARLSERETCRLIFLPGFSTAEKVTGVSGRGVGMDVVKTHIERIGGVVDLETRPERGTTIKIKIPLTLAIIPALVVTSGGERFAIPQVSLLDLVRVEGEAMARAVEQVHGTPVYRLRGRLLPLVDLNQALEIRSEAEDGVVNIVVLKADERQFGLVVDKVIDTEEIVVKPLGKQLKGISAFAGATIMGDGRVALILDVLGLAQRARVVTERREQGIAEHGKEVAARPSEAERERRTFLLFRTGMDDRCGVPLGLVARLEMIPAGQIERASGREVAQYRGGILPLARLASILGIPAPADRDPAPVVVFSEGSRRMGVIVDSILDIVEDCAEITSEAGRRGVLGSAVIAGKVTELIDLEAVIREADPRWFEKAASEAGRTGRRAAGRRVLLAEDSPFFRGMLRAQLEMAGYRVVEAADGVEALERLAGERVDLVLADLEMPRLDGFELARRMKQEERLAALPVVGIISPVRPEDRHRGEAAGLAAVEGKFDREGMLGALARLAATLEEAAGTEEMRNSERTEVHV